MKKIHTRLLIFCIGCLGFYMIARIIPIHAPWLEQGLSCIAYPVLSIQRSIGKSIDDVGQFFKSRKEADTLCRDHQARYEQLLAENIEIKSTLETWKDMQELVFFKKNYEDKENMLVAQILTKNFLPHEHFFLVDAGSDKGIVTDMVAVYKNCLIGRISEVYPQYSRITLITDPTCKVAAFCVDSHDQGIHEGCCKLDQTHLTYIFDPQLDLEKRLKKGDLVISSGEGLVFPRGFGIGHVISHEQKNLQYSITLRPLLDFTKINYCCLVHRGAHYTGTHTQAIESNTQNAKQPKSTQANDLQPIAQNIDIKQKTGSLIAPKTPTLENASNSKKNMAAIIKVLPESASNEKTSIKTTSVAPICIAPTADAIITIDKKNVPLPEQEITQETQAASPDEQSVATEQPIEKTDSQETPAEQQSKLEQSAIASALTAAKFENEQEEAATPIRKDDSPAPQTESKTTSSTSGDPEYTQES